MGIFDRLLTEKKKTPIINSLDSNNSLDGGDSIIVSNGNMNNVQFYQYERGQTETSRIETYRNISKAAEIDEVITDIVNETFIFQNDKRAFELDWHASAKITDQLKEKISQEFDNIYDIMNFEDIGPDLIQSFYIDGRIIFQKIIDKSYPKNGLVAVEKVDPLNLVKVKLVPLRDRNTNQYDLTKVETFYVYSNKKLNNKNYLDNTYGNVDEIVDGIKLDLNDITYVTSGLIDPTINITIGHLDKAIIPYNNLKMMEQSMVIFRVVRAPMRRAFYIDLSSMGATKGEQYMNTMATRFKSKLVYNAETGSWVDQQSVISMVEDYFIPRFNESKTTEIQNIEGQSSQEILEEVNYMSDKLYRSLNAPRSRYKEESSVFVFGKTDNIPRDEYVFKKFIDRLRNRFMIAIDDILKTQLIYKNIISEEDWKDIKKSYFWRFAEDNSFIEYKESQLLDMRIDMLLKVKDVIEEGYYSKLWVKKNILKQTDDEISQISDENFKEANQSPDKLPSPQDNADVDPDADVDVDADVDPVQGSGDEDGITSGETDQGEGDQGEVDQTDAEEPAEVEVPADDKK